MNWGTIFLADFVWRESIHFYRYFFATSSFTVQQSQSIHIWEATSVRSISRSESQESRIWCWRKGHTHTAVFQSGVIRPARKWAPKCTPTSFGILIWLGLTLAPLVRNPCCGLIWIVRFARVPLVDMRFLIHRYRCCGKLCIDYCWILVDECEGKEGE